MRNISNNMCQKDSTRSIQNTVVTHKSDTKNSDTKTIFKRDYIELTAHFFIINLNFIFTLFPIFHEYKNLLSFF